MRSIGEEKLEKFFSLQGFKIIYPEKYTFDEQLQMIGNCDVFASTEGSCGHNSLFLKDGAVNIVLRRANHFVYSPRINHYLKNVNSFYIDSQLSIFAKKDEPWVGPFYYYISKNLIRFFKMDEKYYDSIFQKNFRDINLYIRAAKQSRSIYNGKFDDVSNRIFSESYYKYFDSKPHRVMIRRMRWFVIKIQNHIKRTAKN